MAPLFPMAIGRRSLALNMFVRLDVPLPVLSKLVCMLLYRFTAPGVVNVLTLRSDVLQSTAVLRTLRASWPVPTCSRKFVRHGRQQEFTLRHLLQLGMPLLLMLYGLQDLLWFLHALVMLAGVVALLALMVVLLL